jgi:phosphate transport system permease protein
MMTARDQMGVTPAAPEGAAAGPGLKSPKARPGIRAHARGDAVFRGLAVLGSLLIPVLVAGLLVELVWYSYPAIKQFGLGFLTSQAWNPVTQRFGAASSVFGTLVSTLIALVLAVPLSLAIAFFLVELAPPAVSRVVGTLIELLAAIPSIIYGMWGLFVFAPFMSDYVQPALGKTLGFLPLFQGPPLGIGMLTAGIILAFMILPFICAITRDVFLLVPRTLRESAFGMGATTWEVTRQVLIPYGLVGIIGAVFLGLGRALGETMAVTFVIGNSHRVAASLFAPGNSIASTLANEFAEATGTLYVSSLIELALVLFLITYVVQIISQFMVRRFYRAWSVGL